MRISTLVVSVVAAFVTVSVAQAETFAEKHPRRAEVNKRINNQEKRINQGVKDGQISKAQAKTDRQALRADKRDERADVKANGGYLTKGQQQAENQNLNASSKDIYNQRHPAAPAAPAAPATGAAPTTGQ